MSRVCLVDLTVNVKKLILNTDKTIVDWTETHSKHRQDNSHILKIKWMRSLSPLEPFDSGRHISEILAHISMLG